MHFYCFLVKEITKWAEIFTGWFYYVSLDSCKVWKHLQTFYQQCVMALKRVYASCIDPVVFKDHLPVYNSMRNYMIIIAWMIRATWNVLNFCEPSPRMFAVKPILDVTNFAFAFAWSTNRPYVVNLESNYFLIMILPWSCMYKKSLYWGVCNSGITEIIIYK